VLNVKYVILVGVFAPVKVAARTQITIERHAT
jgi:hypothetical protein